MNARSKIYLLKLLVVLILIILPAKVLKIVCKKCIISNIKINVVCGPGYKYFLELEKMKKKENKLNMRIIKVTDKISKYMRIG